MEARPLRFGIFSNYDISANDIWNQLPQSFDPDLEIYVNEPGNFDAIATLNFSRRFQHVRAPEGLRFRIIQEPNSGSIFHRFAGKSSFYSERLIGPLSPDYGFSPLPWHVGLSSSEASNSEVPVKTKLLSAISSTKCDLPGHLVRNNFIDKLLDLSLHVDIFGRGRMRELDDKLEGLLDYRYSVAIENSSQPGYFTEKFFDPLLAWTVPVYFGAKDVAKFFPSQSFIWLPLDDEKRALEIVCQLAEDDWESRLEAVSEARDLILNKYSLGPVFASIISSIPESNLTDGKPYLIGDFNTLIHGLRGFLYQIAKGWLR